MRFIIAPEFHQQMLEMDYHMPDCYVRPGEYLHHMYIDGVKYVIVPAMLECLQEAIERNDEDAIRHLTLHKQQYDLLLQDALRRGGLEGVTLLGDPPPDDDEAVPVTNNPYFPQSPSRWEDTGLNLPFLFDMIMRAIYNRGRITGNDLSLDLKLPFRCIEPIMPLMRKQGLIDIVGQKGSGGDAAYEYELKPPKGPMAVQDALDKTNYSGPTPVPYDDYIESVLAQTVRKLVVTRRSIRRAFEDLIITDTVFNEIGPAINSASSIFFFGFPGNGKTSVAERITRLMGDEIFIPYAVEANGQIIKVFDPILHQPVKEDSEPEAVDSFLKKGPTYDQRYIKIKRPTIVVGGELTMPMLDLKYNPIGKFYEAPLQMKANGGIFMIDDFGRQQLRPMDLLNRWIVPLEKRYDYLTTITGNKLEIPFDELLIFSTNLDPTQLADEAFLRRIKFKIEIRDPDEQQFRQIWRLVCKSRRVEYDEAGIDYLIEKWYRPTKRPFRMCQPRDILDQMISISKYNMERPSFTPDLIDAGCSTYFINDAKRDFGAKVRLD
ncbi:ATP-binding protein [Tuwongella immobilis]|uniref:AAA ATPase n=1 Tax=Tuwongella immobilis TaxID=692036 RepID=A0A6C2YUH5_9BACT|nr:ATP-binding protein [Tuwongella immobilis]VIP05041.1 AAA ATPase OS=Herpetosiphon aurantiacus (strain ATCC 23779 / DSM 785) GN=Haur_4235 PE=4 SV=1 [Tuwongella immobilis]VTS07438.1 AAA ATPase OS=Herpetosiphon aurantiacus (strain ATCC 23779 / DSM 785) GN=Haur_4235 PE=4 SV=1 [Tuwongella immobilis]